MDLLYPELLTKEQLLAHLSVLKVDNLPQYTRDDLLVLFRKHIMPKPSRNQAPKAESKPVPTKQQPSAYEICNTIQYQNSKLVLTGSPQSLKRTVEDSSEQDDVVPEPKRAKITWP